MGNDNIRGEFDQDNWQVVTTVGIKTILKNKLTSSLLDSYTCDQNVEMKIGKNAEAIYQWRKSITVKEYIPQLYHYQIKRTLLGSMQSQKVFTQHITRFCQLPLISKAEAFLLLQQIISVLPLLFRQFGLFHANIYTIGVSESGLGKVWINQNLAKNNPEPQDVINVISSNIQLVIVNNLVRLLKTKVYNNDIHPEYPFSTGFLQTLKYIRQVRQRYNEYFITKIYINRGQFHQVYRGILQHKNQGQSCPVNQNNIIEERRQLSNKDIYYSPNGQNKIENQIQGNDSLQITTFNSGQKLTANIQMPQIINKPINAIQDVNIQEMPGLQINRNNPFNQQQQRRSLPVQIMNNQITNSPTYQQMNYNQQIYPYQQSNAIIQQNGNQINQYQPGPNWHQPQLQFQPTTPNSLQHQFPQTKQRQQQIQFLPTLQIPTNNQRINTIQPQRRQLVSQIQQNNPNQPQNYTRINQPPPQPLIIPINQINRTPQSFMKKVTNYPPPIDKNNRVNVMTQREQIPRTPQMLSSPQKRRYSMVEQGDRRLFINKNNKQMFEMNRQPNFDIKTLSKIIQQQDSRISKSNNQSKKANSRDTTNSQNQGFNIELVESVVYVKSQDSPR